MKQTAIIKLMCVARSLEKGRLYPEGAEADFGHILEEYASIREAQAVEEYKEKLKEGIGKAIDQFTGSAMLTPEDAEELKSEITKLTE